MNVIDHIKTIKQNNFYQKKGLIRDVIIALIVFFITSTLLYALLSRQSFIHLELSNDFSVLIANILAICLLNQKYPLNLFSPISIKLNLIHVLPALLVCLLIYSPFYYNIWLGGLEILPEQYQLYLGFNIVEKFFFLLFFFLLGPATEEIYIRGFIYRILRNRYNIFWGTLISTAIFYLLHGLSFENLSNINIIFVSLVFTYVYEKTGNIWSSIITHSLNNILWFNLVYWGIKSNI